MDLNWFRIPRDVVYGYGTLEYLRQVGSKRAMIVTGGKSMRRNGFIDRASEYLTSAGAEVSVFDGVEPDPTVATVKRGAEVMREFQPDLIVALGGGSAIDAAKAMWIFYEHPEMTFEQVAVPFGIPTLRNKARFVAVPSTSGTASEVTCVSVITDGETHVKYPLLSYEITPDVAILDPDLPASMPKSITADTGLDALTHAVEAYVSTKASHFSDPLALEAIRLVQQYLPTAVANGEDREARAKMHYGQSLAGMAFTNAFLGITHSMAHNIGAQFGIPHGRANAILLPYVIEYNGRDAEAAYARIADAMGLTGEGSGTARLAAYVRSLNQLVGIPASIKEAGVDPLEFAAKLPEIAQHAFDDPCTGANPRRTSPDEIRAIYERAFNGTL
jgi:alcohol dehydrogenase class IV